jgi:hypothetical protein
MDTQNFNFKNLVLVDGAFIDYDELYNRIYENDGSYDNDDQYMSFSDGTNTIHVYYEISASGTITEDSGDYWTPPICDIDISDLDININSVTIDEDELNLSEDQIDILKKIIDNNL